MRTQKLTAFALAAALLLSLLSGCAQTPVQPTQSISQPTQPDQSTKPAEPLSPPRTVEEFVPRLNEALKEQNIPVSFVFRGQYETYKTGEDGNWVHEAYWEHYLASDPATGSCSDTFDLAVYYPQAPTDPMLKLQLWVDDSASDRERELCRTVSYIAAALCDPLMTTEKLDALFDAERSDTEYTVFTGDIGAFWDWDYAGDANGQLQDNSLRTVYCRSGEITHSITGYVATKEEWYELAFDPALYAEKEIPLPTVAQLEAGINAYFKENGIPLQCEFRIDSYADNYTYIGDVPALNYGEVYWTGKFWITDWNVPNFPYPQRQQASGEPQSQEFNQAVMLQALSYEIYIGIRSKSAHKDAPVSYVGVSGSNLPILELIPPAVVSAWDEAVGSDAVTAFCTTAKQSQTVSEETEEYELEYSLQDGLLRFGIGYKPVRSTLLQEAPEPQPVEWNYHLSAPILQNGWFEHYIHPTDPLCYRAIISAIGDCFEPLSELMEDYVESWGLLPITQNSNVSVFYGDWLMDSPYELVEFSYYDSAKQAYLYLNPMLFGGFMLELEGFADDAHYTNNRQMYAVYYNESEEALPYAQLPYRAAVGLAQLMDENISVQQAVELLAKDGTPDIQVGNWSAYSYSTGEVVHVVCKNTQTKQTIYHVMPQKLIDAYFLDLEAFVEYAVGEYEYLTYPEEPRKNSSRSILWYPDMGFSTEELPFPSSRAFL